MPGVSATTGGPGGGPRAFGRLPQGLVWALCQSAWELWATTGLWLLFLGSSEAQRRMFGWGLFLHAVSREGVQDPAWVWKGHVCLRQSSAGAPSMSETPEVAVALLSGLGCVRSPSQG